MFFAEEGKMTPEYVFLDMFLGYWLQVLPVMLLAALLCWRIRYKKDIQASRREKLLGSVFIGYLAGMVLIVLARSETRELWYMLLHGGPSGEKLRFFNWSFTLLPDISLSLLSGVKIQYAWMFFPFGLLFPFFKKECTLKDTMLWGLICAVVLEVLKPIFGMEFDLNTILLCVFSVLMGALLLIVLRSRDPDLDK